MKMKRLLFFVIALSMAMVAVAQAPSNYYNSANGLQGQQLKVALHNIIKGHTTISYSQIWNAFWSTDNKGNGVVWDMYSDRPNGNPPYTYYLGQDQCGSYDSEGDCYNREHSWPESWFNSDGTARTDLHHIFATDGYVNNRRGNYPLGEVRSASWTSQNGSKLGTCKTSGYSGTVFEPIDEYKGDFARALMYMTVRYYGEDSGWGNSDMTNKAVIKPWAIDMLLRWNKLDPVSQKEIDRNNAIYRDYQHNRNPFIDHPEYADMIWDETWGVNDYAEQNEAKANRLVVYDLTGRMLLQMDVNSEQETDIDLKGRLRQGCYFIQYLDGNRVIKSRKLLVN
jgi:endonuclease I